MIYLAYIKDKIFVIGIAIGLIQPVFGSDMAASAVRSLASKCRYIEGDRSVFYIRTIDEESLGNRLEYACMVVVYEPKDKKDIIITYWPLFDRNDDWIKAENIFFEQFLTDRPPPSGREVRISSSDMPIICDFKRSRPELRVNMNRSIIKYHLPHLFWRGVLIWGNSYTQIGNNIIELTARSNIEVKNGLNMLINSVFNMVLDDGFKNGIWCNKNLCIKR